ncbi:MAG TPA: diguanylate cyclase [Vicinamibacterales bacterium]|nr:diguanylate cyclase [Vicinamibacterales bacterium]
MTDAALPRVLVADDQIANSLIVARALKGEFDVVQATTGAEVLERAAAGDIDLLLLDVVMPEMDGFEICRRLKANPVTAAIPVIFITALEQSVDETQGFSVGAVDYITKPIRPSIVRARVRTHVELKRTRDLLEQLASVDPLTGVANRRRFDAALQEEWRRTARAGRWLSIAIVDVDDFKRFNDRYGHLAGDDRLRGIAASLARSTRRAGDLVARYGGEEFGLILPEVEPSMMHGVIRALLIGVTADSAGTPAPDTETVTVSVGAVSVKPGRDKTTTGALSAADRLLYQAKAAGRDRGIHLDLASLAKTVIQRGEAGDLVI